MIREFIQTRGLCYHDVALTQRPDCLLLFWGGSRWYWSFTGILWVQD